MITYLLVTGLFILMCIALIIIYSWKYNDLATVSDIKQIIKIMPLIVVIGLLSSFLIIGITRDMLLLSIAFSVVAAISFVVMNKIEAAKKK